MEPETIALARKMEAASETQYRSERPDGVWVLWDERGDFDHRMAPAAAIASRPDLAEGVAVHRDRWGAGVLAVMETR